MHSVPNFYYYFRGRRQPANQTDHHQLKESDAELYKCRVDDGVVSHKNIKVTDKPDKIIGDAYRCGEILATSDNASVYNGIRICDALSVAIKIVKKTKITTWKSYQGEDIPMEAYLNKQLATVDGVVKMLDYFDMPTTCVFVFEKPVECMDLFDYMTKKGKLGEPLARHFMNQIVDTLVECQSHGVIHRNIKDENIVMDLVRHQVKIIDFGSGSTVQAEKYTEFNSIRVNSPPEFISDGWYFGEALTVWMLGSLMFNMVQGKIPFQNDMQILTGEVKFNTEVSNHCQHLIKWCLSKPHTDRPTLNQILQHPWINLPY